MKKVLTIAGSDSSGGAGIQADIKTITVHGMYAMTVITALTAQNTTGVSGIQEVPAEFVAKQLDAVFQDIRPDAVKIGMLSGPEVMETVAERLRFYQAEHIVVDPVMVATSGSALMKNGAAETLLKTLLPLAELITPNLPEGEALSGMKIENSGDMARAAEWIGKQTGSAVLLKGGHLKDKADDFLWIRGGGRWFVGEKLQNPNTHGTGCTLSSALACKPGGRKKPAGQRRAGQSLCGRSHRRRPGSGSGQRPSQSYVRSGRIRIPLTSTSPSRRITRHSWPSRFRVSSRSARSGLTCTVISGVFTWKLRALATLAAMRLARSPASRSNSSSKRSSCSGLAPQSERRRSTSALPRAAGSGSSFFSSSRRFRFSWMVLATSKPQSSPKVSSTRLLKVSFWLLAGMGREQPSRSSGISAWSSSGFRE